MMFINTETGEYPVSELEIREAHPEFCYPIPFEPCPGYAAVLPAPLPEYNPATHRVDEIAPLNDGKTWVQQWRVVELTAAELEELLLFQQARLAAAVTVRRWEIETGGIALPGDLRIDTGRSDQDAITRVLVNAQAAGIAEVQFKAASGWVQLTIDQLRQIANAVALHVQACYEAEYAHHEAIKALPTLAEALDYDVDSGWPT